MHLAQAEGCSPIVHAFKIGSTQVTPVKPNTIAKSLAIGNPVALDANAEDLLTRGFISIMIHLPFSGLTANCTLDPPVSTPIVRKHWIALFLIC